MRLHKCAHAQAGCCASSSTYIKPGPAVRHTELCLPACCTRHHGHMHSLPACTGPRVHMHRLAAALVACQGFRSKQARTHHYTTHSDIEPNIPYPGRIEAIWPNTQNQPFRGSTPSPTHLIFLLLLPPHARLSQLLLLGLNQLVGLQQVQQVHAV